MLPTLATGATGGAETPRSRDSRPRSTRRSLRVIGELGSRSAATPRVGPLRSGHSSPAPRTWPRAPAARPLGFSRPPAPPAPCPRRPARPRPPRALRPASTCCGPAGARRWPVARPLRIAGAGGESRPHQLTRPPRPPPISAASVTWVALRSAVAAPVAVAASSLLRHGAPMTRPENRSALFLGSAPAGPPPPGPAAQTGEPWPARAGGGDGERSPEAARARRAPSWAGAAPQTPRRTRSERSAELGVPAGGSQPPPPVARRRRRA